jgi:hypothetical protein
MSTSSSSGPSPSPDSALVWVQEDSQGNRWVFYRSSTGTVYPGQQLTGTVSAGQQLTEAAGFAPQAARPPTAAPASHCIWTGYCWIC